MLTDPTLNQRDNSDLTPQPKLIDPSASKYDNSVQLQLEEKQSQQTDSQDNDLQKSTGEHQGEEDFLQWIARLMMENQKQIKG